MEIIINGTKYYTMNDISRLKIKNIKFVKTKRKKYINTNYANFLSGYSYLEIEQQIVDGDISDIDNHIDKLSIGCRTYIYLWEPITRTINLFEFLDVNITAEIYWNSPRYKIVSRYTLKGTYYRQYNNHPNYEDMFCIVGLDKIELEDKALKHLTRDFCIPYIY